MKRFNKQIVQVLIKYTKFAFSVKKEKHVELILFKSQFRVVNSSG